MPKSKKTKKAQSPKKGPLDFNQRVIMFLNVLLRMVKEQRGRGGGATKFGADGMFVLLNEAADTAKKAGPQGFLSAATYALCGAMMVAEQWDEPQPKKRKAKKGKEATESKPKE